MKRGITLFTIAAMFLGACQSSGEQAKSEGNAEITKAAAEANKPVGEENGVVSPSMFGEEITIEKVTSKDELMAQLGETDTVKDIVVSGKINKCCQKKGCWMKVDLGDENEVFVKFEDYGFFMPLDCGGSTAIMQGMAYSDTVSVDELRHYAEDAGKSEEEIAAITEPEVKYSFMATGVILKDYVRSDSKMEEEMTEGESSEE